MVKAPRQSGIYARVLVVGLMWLVLAPEAAAQNQPRWPDMLRTGTIQGGGGGDAAVIVGIEDYAFVSDVAGAVTNAKGWYLYLSKMRGVPGANIRLLSNADGSKERIEKHLREVAKEVKPDGTLWFVFIGHGAPSSDGKDGILVGVDAQQSADSLYVRSLSRDSVMKILAKGGQARTVVVLDTCFSGQTDSGEALAGDLQPMLPVSTKGLLKAKTFVFTAGTSRQFAGPLPGLNRPAFSYLLLGAFRGWADRDKNGAVTALEAREYTANTFKQLLVGRSQTPELWTKEPGSVLAQSRSFEAGPDLDAMVLGRSTDSGGGGVDDEWNPEGIAGFVVAFESSPSGAVVMLNGELLCQNTPCSKMVPKAGRFKVTMQKERYVKRLETLALRSGSKVSWSLEPNFGELTINSSPSGLAVHLDEREIGKTPISKVKVATGEHTLVIKDPCFKEIGSRLSLKRGESKSVTLDATPRPSAINVTAVDGKGNDLIAEVWVDGDLVGKTPGVFKTSLCAKEVEVRMKGLNTYRQTLTLRERQTTLLKARLAREDVTKDGAPMVKVPAGKFLMGSKSGDSDEKPQREVYLDGFWIDKYEVTVDLYARCVKAGKCTKPKTGKYYNWDVSGRGNHPINGVDWYQANAYCKWTGKKLPTEAMWEKAARGTDGRKFPWGNQEASCKYAVMDDGGKGCGRDSTWPVGSKPGGVSPYGAHDMAGNVWEWTSDWYGSSYYGNAPARNPRGPSSGSFRVVRGGRWYYVVPAYLRAANRYFYSPGGAYYDIGMRCARSFN